MSVEKLSSAEVPEKFTDWLLLLGCPPEKVPSVEKMSQMCRGQYYMVWRSMIEHVYPRDVIKQKRLQVFCDDVKNCQNKNEIDHYLGTVRRRCAEVVYVAASLSNCAQKDTVVPEEILLWRQQKELKEKVAKAEQKVSASHQNLHELIDYISSKVAQRNISRKQAEDLQRRNWMLAQVREELSSKKETLQETKAIAVSLCSVNNNDDDVKNKLDKYVSTFERTSPQRNDRTLNASILPAETVVSGTDNNDEECLNNLLKCSSSAIWSQLIERRAELTSELAEHIAQLAVKHKNDSVTPQSVLANTIALQCTLALESVKNKIRWRNAYNRIASLVPGLQIYQSDACELFVHQSELVEMTARIESMKQTCEDLVSRTGVFEVTGENIEVKKKMPTYRAMENKKEELNRLVTALSITERKIQKVRDHLLAVFNAFYKDTPMTELEKYKGIQIDLPLDSISSLRKFYEERSERKSKNMELSLNFDVSDISINDNADSKNITFVDELKVYMKNFNLEKNRKLVLESGAQIWIFETLSSYVERYQRRLLNDNIMTSMICPTQSVTYNLRGLLDELQKKIDLEDILASVKIEPKDEIDFGIEEKKQQEDKRRDAIKKRLGENIQILKTTDKTLDQGQETLQFWKENMMKNYISSERRVNGRTYKEYEMLYLEAVNTGDCLLYGIN